MIHQNLLDKGDVESLVLALRSIDSSNPELAETVRTTANYFETNAQRMRYPEFRSQHLFVGSGVIEAGCKTVIGSRCKQSGMFWTVRAANSILALRCWSHQWPLRGLLGGPPGLTSTFMSHTLGLRQLSRRNAPAQVSISIAPL